MGNLLKAAVRIGQAMADIARAPYFIVGPWLDNHLSILTRRDLRAFLSHRVGEASLEQLINRRAGAVQWTARHDEFIWASELDAQSNEGQVYRWDVSHLPPREWLPSQSLYVTPLNRSAADLVPELLPAGLDRRHLPEAGYHAGFVHDLARAGGNPGFGAWVESNRRHCP